MDAVRREEMQSQPRVVKAVMGTERKALKGLMWGMRKNPSDWNANQRDTMYQLQRSNQRSARAGRLKQALRDVYADALHCNDPAQAEAALQRWISWARRCRLDSFKRLATTFTERLPGFIRGMLDGLSNVYVEAMNGMLQQTKAAARGFRTVRNFVAIAYLRMSKLTHLPKTPMCTAGIMRARHYPISERPSSSIQNGIEPIKVSTASEHDTLHFEDVLDPSNTSRDILTDKGYVDGEREARLRQQGWRVHIQRKGSKDKPISATQERRNRRIAKTRARVEHVFAGLAQLGGKTLRSIGLARATLHLNWKVAAYNLRCLAYLKEAGIAAF